MLLRIGEMDILIQSITMIIQVVQYSLLLLQRTLEIILIYLMIFPKNIVWN